MEARARRTLAARDVAGARAPALADAARAGGTAAILFEGAGFYASLEFLAQVRGTFLVCSGADGLYVLDQHAAAERVTFDRLRRAFASRTIATQRLLIPEVVELLAHRGRDARGARGGRRGARASSCAPWARAPSPCTPCRRSSRALAPSASCAIWSPSSGTRDRRPFGDAADLVLATMACHGSIRAGDALSREEAVALLRALDDIDFAGHCPHGRPVVTRIGYDELERRVGR